MTLKHAIWRQSPRKTISLAILPEDCLSVISTMLQIRDLPNWTLACTKTHNASQLALSDMAHRLGLASNPPLSEIIQHLTVTLDSPNTALSIHTHFKTFYFDKAFKSHVNQRRILDLSHLVDQYLYSERFSDLVHLIQTHFKSHFGAIPNHYTAHIKDHFVTPHPYNPLIIKALRAIHNNECSFNTANDHYTVQPFRDALHITSSSGVCDVSIAMTSTGLFICRGHVQHYDPYTFKSADAMTVTVNDPTAPHYMPLKLFQGHLRFSPTIHPARNDSAKRMAVSVYSPFPQYADSVVWMDPDGTRNVFHNIQDCHFVFGVPLRAERGIITHDDEQIMIDGDVHTYSSGKLSSGNVCTRMRSLKNGRGSTVETIRKPNFALAGEIKNADAYILKSYDQDGRLMARKEYLGRVKFFGHGPPKSSDLFCSTLFITPHQYDQIELKGSVAFQIDSTPASASYFSRKYPNGSAINAIDLTWNVNGDVVSAILYEDALRKNNLDHIQQFVGFGIDMTTPVTATFSDPHRSPVKRLLPERLITDPTCQAFLDMVKTPKYRKFWCAEREARRPFMALTEHPFTPEKVDSRIQHHFKWPHLNGSLDS